MIHVVVHLGVAVSATVTIDWDGSYQFRLTYLDADSAV